MEVKLSRQVPMDFMEEMLCTEAELQGTGIQDQEEYVLRRTDEMVLVIIDATAWSCQLINRGQTK